MDCCGRGGSSHGWQASHSGHDSHNEGKITWAQVVAVGLVLMFLLSFLLNRH